MPRALVRHELTQTYPCPPGCPGVTAVHSRSVPGCSPCSVTLQAGCWPRASQGGGYDAGGAMSGYCLTRLTAVFLLNIISFGANVLSDGPFTPCTHIFLSVHFAWSSFILTPGMGKFMSVERQTGRRKGTKSEIAYIEKNECLGGRCNQS